MKDELSLPPQGMPPELWKKMMEGQKELVRRRKLFLETEKYAEYLMSFPSHERDAAFFRFVRFYRLSNPMFWQLLRDVWTSMETSFTHRRKWLQLFRSPRSHRKHLM